MTQPAAQPGGLTVDAVVGDTYQLTRLIGQGGMGAVWEASHLRLPGKYVAVKVLLQTISAESEAFARFRREAEIASRLGHPNIVEVLDFNVLPSGAPYLVLELLEGENLAARLARGPIAVAEALALARQIGSALAAAHKSGVVHRDLKPENVFLCPPTDEDATIARVKVLDFGISKIAGSTTLQTQEQRVMGTPQYMAPEQAKGQNKQVDQRSDVFALGAIVYEMLAGKPAFQGENLAEVVFKVVYEKPEPLTAMAPDAPPAVVAAIERALAKEPAERWPDVGAFIEALTGRPLAATVDRGSRISTPPPRVSLGSGPGAKTPPGASQGGAGAKTPPGASQGAGGAKTPPGGAAAGGAASGPGAFAETLISGDHAGPLAGSETPRADAHAATMASVGASAAAAAAPVPGPAAPPAKTTTLATKKRGGVISTVVGIAVVGGAIGLWASRGGSGDAGPPGGGAAGGGARATADAGAGPVAVTPSAGDAGPAADAAAIVALAPADAGAVLVAVGPADAGVKRPPSPSPSPSPSPTGGGDGDPGGNDDEPPKARELLDQAQAALGAGEYKDAIRLAMRSLNEKKLPRAYVVIAKAYCHMGDLGNAKAQLPNLPARLRVGVVRYCKKVGVDLGG